MGTESNGTQTKEEVDTEAEGTFPQTKEEVGRKSKKTLPQTKEVWFAGTHSDMSVCSHFQIAH